MLQDWRSYLTWKYPVRLMILLCQMCYPLPLSPPASPVKEALKVPPYCFFLGYAPSWDLISTSMHSQWLSMALNGFKNDDDNNADTTYNHENNNT